MLQESQAASVRPSLSEADRARLLAQVALASESVARNWPLRTVIARNPLQALEHLPFDDAVRRGQQLFGGRGYLTNEEFRALYAQGRITREGILRALRLLKPELAAQVALRAGARAIEAAEVLFLHLVYGLDAIDPHVLHWKIDHEDALRRIRPDVPADARQRILSRTRVELTHERAVRHELDGRLRAQKERAGPAAPRMGDPEARYVSAVWGSLLQVLDLGDRSEFGSLFTDGRHSHDSASQAAGPDLPSEPLERTVAEWIGALTSVDVVQQINEQMIKWCGAFLDEGLAAWGMPERRQGFYQAWRDLAWRDLSLWFLGIRGGAKTIRTLPDQPEEVLAACLHRLDIPSEQWTEYLARHLTLLPGWAGLIRWRAENPDYPEQHSHPINLTEYLAVRIWYEAELAQRICRSKLGIDARLPALRASAGQTRAGDRADHAAAGPAAERTRRLCRDAWRLFHAAQFLELFPDEIHALGRSGLQAVLRLLDCFPPHDHGPVWQEAYEERYRHELISRLTRHRARSAVVQGRPRAQAVFCIDVRSEPLRRHLEAQGEYETLGFAGFFGVPLCFRPMETEREASLCPVLIRPKHRVAEVPRTGQERLLGRSLAGSSLQRALQHLFHELKSSLLASYPLVDVIGWVYGLVLLGKTVLLAPYRSLRRKLQGQLIPPVPTQIPIEKLAKKDAEAVLAAKERTVVEEAVSRYGGRRSRSSRLLAALSEELRLAAITGAAAADEDGVASAPVTQAACMLELSREQEQSLLRELRERYGLNAHRHAAELERLLAYGFAPEEQAVLVETALRLMGLTGNFARLVLLCGHGSTSENNPMAAALDCGACGGNHGGPNARVLASMANRSRVRARLLERGIAIPDDTWFIAGKHDTTTDRVIVFDQEEIPETHEPDLKALLRALEQAGAQVALERCRRLPASPKRLTAEQAVRHVRQRSADWSQIRPEWGLSSNAACIIGRRALTRGLDLHGRVFLHSYDPSQDEDGKRLEVIMTAPLVVMQMINLQYYFSSVDPWVYGSGSKVIHNVAGGVGVMLGRQSDLQAGLPLQSVMDGPAHFHEPLRLLAIIEAPATRINSIIERHLILQRFFNNGWVSLLAVDPATGAFHRYRPGGEWEPYRVEAEETR